MTRRIWLTVAMAVAVAGGTSVWAGEAAADNYAADPSHGSVGFQVPHLVISKVRGEFKTYEAALQVADGKLVSASATIQAASVSTGNADRDKHLVSPEFFDVAKFPTLTFKSTAVEAGKLTGDLTIHGVTKSVTLKSALNGPVNDPWGNTKVGLELTGRINRQDFGLTWSKALETGGLVVGDEVDLEINLEFAKQK